MPSTPHGEHTNQPRGRRGRDWRWPVTLAVVFMLTAAVVVLAGLLLTRPPATPTAAAAPPATPAAALTQPATQVQVDAELAERVAALLICQDTALRIVGPVNQVRGTWNRHGEAHAKGRTGEFTEAKMKAEWRITLARRLPEDMVLVAARDAMERACAKG